MIVLRTILYKTAQGLVALLIIFHTWTQCSSRSDVREVWATVKGFITITCIYDTYQYKNLGSSWCRQISAIECENIVQTMGFKPSIYKERVNVSQTMDHFGTVNVTIFNLQPWDSGLYNWRVWNGNDYEIIQTVLLQVINGLPPNIRVARFKLHEITELHCEYASNIKNSKVWYKKINEKRSSWVAHSNGNKGTDYKSRVIVINDEQKKRLTLQFQQVELWDSGIYQCSASNTILTEILLIVTMDNESKSLSPTDGITQSSHLNTYYPSMFHQSSTLNNSYATQQPPPAQELFPGCVEQKSFEAALCNIIAQNYSTTCAVDLCSSSRVAMGLLAVSPIECSPCPACQFRWTAMSWSRHRHKPWNIMRWILFLSMVLCVVIFSHYKRSSEDISGVWQIYNRSRRSQIRNISKV